MASALVKKRDDDQKAQKVQVVHTKLTYYRDAFGCKGANPLNGGLEMEQALANARSKDGKTDRTGLSNKVVLYFRGEKQ